MGFGSTPAFALFRRGLITQAIQKFRGINIFQSFSVLTPDWAQDALNVIVGSDGGLHKFRLPQTISPNLSEVSGPQTFIDFQQANGTRQVVAFFGDGSFQVFTSDMTANTLIETNAANAGLWSLVNLKNMLYGTNGQRMKKWLGNPVTLASWQNIGIAAPTVVPQNQTGIIATLQRTTNVVTAVFTTPVDLNATSDFVVISGAGDPSFNGAFLIATKTDQTHYTWAQTAANLGPVSGGTYAHIGANPNWNISAATRTAGITTVTVTASSNDTSALGPDFLASARNVQITIASATDATMDGTFPLISKQANVFTFAQPNSVDSAGGSAGTVSGPLANTTGAVSICYAYRNSVTGAVSNQSPAVGPFGAPSHAISYNLVAPASPDPQVDSVMWFRTLAGGGNFYLDHIETGNGGNATLSLPDLSLDTTQQAPLINNPPLQGKFMAVGQGRLFIANLNGSPQDIIYSGYEQILLGNPPECFPPNNRLRLSIGAESCNGVGVLHAGVVAFSQTGRMYMLRGQVEDITVTTPVNFTQFLEELPWQLGCLSHYSIQATPYGLVWLAADKTVQFFDGSNKPQDISAPIYPLLRNITPGTEGNVVSAYFNWLDRDWYALSCAINGSQTNNQLFIWSLHSDAGQIEIFKSDIQADYLGMVTSSKSQRQLIIAQGGRLKNLPIAQDTAGGLVSDLTIIPATSGQMNAYWRSMYFGTESPYRSKMFRRGKLITDQGGFNVQFRLVDDVSSTFLQPKILGPLPVLNSIFKVNQRANRCSVEIDFPVQDVSANVIELQLGAIGTSDR